MNLPSTLQKFFAEQKDARLRGELHRYNENGQSFDIAGLLRCHQERGIPAKAIKTPAGIRIIWTRKQYEYYALTWEGEPTGYERVPLDALQALKVVADQRYHELSRTFNVEWNQVDEEEELRLKLIKINQELDYRT